MFLGHLSNLQMPKLKGSHVNICNTAVKSPQRKTKFTLVLLKWLIYIENFSPFSLFSLCFTVHILIQLLGTLHAYYTNDKNYIVTRRFIDAIWSIRQRNCCPYNWRPVLNRRHWTAPLNDQCFPDLTSQINLNILNWHWIEPVCLANFNTTQEIKIILRLFLSQS